MRHMTLVPRLSYICPLPTRLWLQESHRLLEFAPLQFDMYRRQRRFPTHAFSLLTTVVRSTLTQAMMIGEQRSAAQHSTAQLMQYAALHNYSNPLPVRLVAGPQHVLMFPAGNSHMS